MTKAELLKNWQRKVEDCIPGGLSREKHDILLDNLGKIMVEEILGGGEIPLPGLGKLIAKRTKARRGKNPRTGEDIVIPAGMRVAFFACKEMKGALKGN